MNSNELIVQAFGEELGLKDFSLDGQGKVTLETTSGRRLSIESNDGHVFIYLSQIAQYNAADCLFQAWKNAYFCMQNDFPIHTGLRVQDGQQRILALIRFSSKELSLLNLRYSLERLAAWLDAAQSAQSA